MLNRRDLLVLCGAWAAAGFTGSGLLQSAHAGPRDAKKRIADLTGGVKPQKGRVKITLPDVTDQGQKIFVYCNTGGRASLAGKSLQELGFTEVAVVDMKLTEWIDAGFPIEKTH